MGYAQLVNINHKHAQNEGHQACPNQRQNIHTIVRHTIVSPAEPKQLFTITTINPTSRYIYLKNSLAQTHLVVESLPLAVAEPQSWPALLAFQWDLQ